MKSQIINHKSQIKHGFTLIELLVVIAIIGVLMSLLFPALSAARQRARISRALMEMNQIETAWISYRNDYRHFPQGLNRMQGDALKILRGEQVDDYNKRRIAYMEFADSITSFDDPWGRAYYFALARPDNPNRVTVMIIGEGMSHVHRPVAVWSMGSGKAIKGW